MTRPEGRRYHPGMLKIYHAKRARSARVIWLLEELGDVPYSLEVLEFKPEVLRAPDHLARHPLGLVPVMDDGPERIIESGAILQYLLEKHGRGRLEPQPGAAGRAAFLQWFHFGEVSLAAHVSDIVRQRFGLPKVKSDDVLANARAQFLDSAAVVDRALAGREYICGDSFSAADIMLSYGFIMARITRELPAELSQVAAYLERLKVRPAYVKAWA
jgi:glutathione S-transferase